MKLSDKTLRVKVAEADGWVPIHKYANPWWGKDGFECSLSLLPTYDLNACAALRDGLIDEERVQYIAYLVSQVSIGSRIRELYWAIANATPRQHCLAFLKCKGVEL